MITNKEWIDVFGCYQNIYKVLTADSSFDCLDALCMEKAEKIKADVSVRLEKKDVNRPIYVFFLEDFSYCWIFAYDNFYVLKRLDDESYEVLKQIEYFNIKSISDTSTASDMEATITYKTNSGVVDAYKLDNSIPRPIIEEVIGYIKLIHAEPCER